MKTLPADFWAKLNEDHTQWLSLISHSANVAAVAEALLGKTLLGPKLARLLEPARRPTSPGLSTPIQPTGLPTVEVAPKLHPGQIARLGFLAALHDFGKTNVRFQCQVLDDVRQRGGHVVQALGLIMCQGPEDLSNQLYDCRQINGLMDWGPPEAMTYLVQATLCHHGQPHSRESRVFPQNWAPSHGLDPFRGIQELADAAQAWFPAAFEPDIPGFPTVPAFAHAWNGVLNLADWLGSHDRFFPLQDLETPPPEPRTAMAEARERAAEALRQTGLDTRACRASLGGRPRFEDLLPADERSWKLPRPAQAAIGRLPIDPAGSITVLEASTGAGKTEAALWHFARLFQAGAVDGLYFALPTRTAATQIYRRVLGACRELFADLEIERQPPVVQAVPGYLMVDGEEGNRLPGFEVLWSSEEDTDSAGSSSSKGDGDGERPFRPRYWAGEQSKRYLAGAIVVGTVDQVLVSALQVRHSHMRASCLLRHLLVVDEVHASDAYMTRLMETVLQRHLAAGGHALLMSATLGGEARRRLLEPQQKKTTLEEAIGVPFPLLRYRGASAEVADTAPLALEEPLSLEEEGPDQGEGSEGSNSARPQKVVRVDLAPIQDDPEAIAARAFDAARTGARVLVIRNTVGGCREVQEALELLAKQESRPDLLFGVSAGSESAARSVAAPHHSRYAPSDRKILDGAIEAAFEANPQRPAAGCVAVSTQTVEQSLDLDSDLLITDLCPADVLLQRIGRLHRHALPRPRGFEQAAVVVLTPVERNLGEQLHTDGGCRSQHGLGGQIYEDLRVIEATWRQLEKHPELRLPNDCRRLVEYSTHPAALAELTAEFAGELGELWQKHSQLVGGKTYARRGKATLATLDWQKPYGRELFPSDEARLMTRLGEQEILLPLADTPLGPFGQPVAQLSLRAYEIGWGARDDDEPNAADRKGDAGELEASDLQEHPDGGFTFGLRGKRFVYDRMGLRAEASPQETPTRVGGSQG